MRGKRSIRLISQLLVILIAIGLIYRFCRVNPPPAPPVGGGDNDEDDVKYSPQVPVSVAPITLATLHGYVFAYGTVEAAPADRDTPSASAIIKSPFSAMVDEVSCVEGQHVEKGQQLFRLDPRSAAAATEQARQNLESAKENLSRFDKAAGVPEQWRLGAQHAQDQAQAALDAAIARESLLDFTSPLAGTVVQLNIRPGEVADPSTTAVQIVDLSRLVIALHVPGWQLHDIQPGQDVELLTHRADSPLTIDAQIPATGPATEPATQPTTEPASFAGKVVFIDPQIDPATGMGSVDVSVPPQMKLRPGEFASVRIVVREHKDCLTVPSVSLVRDADDNWGINVAVRDFQWSFRRAVKVGLSEGDRVEIEGDGLKAGQFVVTTGASALPEKSRIEISK